ncbi:MAG: hypothetical protein NTW78_06055 [Campylobacterales bacterium]|nr:hypothetical protein [Campylobacterales bacterium]
MIQRAKKKFKAFCSTKACTCFIDSWFGTNIGECCKAHDYEYEIQVHSKEVADLRLFKCIRAKTNVVLAGVMWSGVRAGGYITSWNRIKKERENVK